jgi:hypothetical protein
LSESEIREEQRFAAGSPFFRKLDKEVHETEIYGVSVDRLELFRCKAAVHVLLLVMYDRRVLGHEAYGQKSTEFKEKGGQGVDGVFDVAGKDEMPDHRAPARQQGAAFEGIQEAFLPDHFGYCPEGNIRVISGPGELCGQRRVSVLEVREIDVRVRFSEL